jgi:Pyruvate/2-oxoacid:ferredoxin oxidoreductase delta subunit
VPAIGQDPELAGLAPLFEADGALLRTDAHGGTSLEGVFAGGDVASGARFVTQAIGMGKSAALQIDRWLQGQAGDEGASESAVPASAINTAYYPHAARPQEVRLAPDARLAGTAEVQSGLAVEKALEEAARCFSCGNCVFCDNCFYYCPDMAVRRVAGGYRIAEDYCKGCGLCVRECPTGSMAMREERR